MKNICVIGAGTMGNGIAHVFAMHQYDVVLCDIDQNALDKAIKTTTVNMDRMIAKEKITEKDKLETLAHITTSTDLAQSVEHTDLVVEAATENVDLKMKIFKHYCN